MKFSENWLREWVNPSCDSTELTEQLTMAGLEVDDAVPAAAEFSGVIVGQVKTCERHPDADKLHVCEVNLGDETKVIVCGAPNVRPDLKVAVATVGAVLPGNFKIKKAKLRGIESNGMICSRDELGIGECDGIMELPSDAPVGDSLRDYLQLDDTIIDVDLTPNRADCLSIQGIAREVGVINQLGINSPKIQTSKAEIKDQPAIELAAANACPRYVARLIKGINQHTPTPAWLVERLRRSGIRSLHPVVDVTNYVMVELGQPMHAFDLNKLHGGIQVRMAKPAEKITLLDQTEQTLSDKDCVIADDKQALALAGVMGGASSAVDTHTTDILLESAYFDPTYITRSAKRYKLHTDSSHRFERGVDPSLQERAIDRATALLLSIVGGQAGPVVAVEDKAQKPVRPNVTLRRERIQRILGITIDDKTVDDILTRLDFQPVKTNNGWQITVPDHRFDISLEIDLIEELARVYGYDQIPSAVPITPTQALPSSEARLSLRLLRNQLTAHGYREIITYSFVDPKIQSILDATPGVALANPISQDLSVMRRSLWPGLIQTLKYNLRRQQDRLRLFETGLCFINSDKGIDQVSMLGGLVMGPIRPEQWGEPARTVDFYDVKADLESIFGLTGCEYSFKLAKSTALHPGKSAEIFHEDKFIGSIGALHPVILQKLNLPGPIFVFELTLDTLLQAQLPQFQAFSKFPSVRRDLAVVVDEKVEVEEILVKIRLFSKKLLNNVHIFDIYQGEGVDLGKKSVALALQLQHPNRTLVEKEVDEFFEDILQVLQTEFNAILRT